MAAACTSQRTGSLSSSSLWANFAFLEHPFDLHLNVFLVGLPSACTWKMSFKDCFEFKTDWVAGSNAAA